MTTWLSNAVVDRLRVVATWPELPGDRYVIERPIGRGGMGTVYVGRDTLLEREVAIKVSNAPVAGANLDERLRQEAQVLARLEHPGIVPVHDAGLLADGRLFYVMKLVRGETLSAYSNRLQGEAAVLGVFERVTETTAFAHEAGVIHRDLKPSNVMVGRFGEVLVLDWGVARMIEDAATLPGTRVGTPGFMPPEQARGETAATSTTSDVFALGALLFWMLTGDTPPGPSDDALSRLNAAAARPARRLVAIVLKCLAAEPSDRYANAAALAADLARYRSGQSVAAHRETILERLGIWFVKYRTFILLVAAYLVMRAMFAFLR
jgi:eukaryotic-like serine/threonine-protein kinase